jgi:hypothetical protein
METSKTTRELAIGWFNSKASLEKTRLCDTNTEIVGTVRRWETLTGREIELIYLSEHPTETESKGQEHEVDWLTPEESLAKENKALMEANERLKEALKKNHQWTLCLLADIEAGNVEYDEKYCLELNQDISETTNLLK